MSLERITCLEITQQKNANLDALAVSDMSLGQLCYRQGLKDVRWTEILNH
jgi:hypothetical protein